MYKVFNNDNVIIKIDNFIGGYLNSFLSLFEDSGIEDVKIIENNYIKTSQKLKEEILTSINNALIQNQIFGHSPITKRKLSIYTKAGNYRLKIFYIENKTQKLRKIYDIEFHK